MIGRDYKRTILDRLRNHHRKIYNTVVTVSGKKPSKIPQVTTVAVSSNTTTVVLPSADKYDGRVIIAAHACEVRRCGLVLCSGVCSVQGGVSIPPLPENKIQSARVCCTKGALVQGQNKWVIIHSMFNAHNF